MGKREILEETTYLMNLLEYYNKRNFENSKEFEKTINFLLDRILDLRRLLEEENFN
jgi:hypothetical protein